MLRLCVLAIDALSPWCSQKTIKLDKNSRELQLKISNFTANGLDDALVRACGGVKKTGFYVDHDGTSVFSFKLDKGAAEGTVKLWFDVLPVVLTLQADPPSPPGTILPL